MYRTILSSAASTLALIAGAAALSIGSIGAQAADAKIKSISYDTESAGMTLHVGSNDGKTWNVFKSGNLHFNAKIKIDTKWPGYIEYVGIVLGHCGGAQCKAMPKVWAASIAQRDMNRNVSLYFPSSLIPIGSPTGIPVIPDASEIFGKCNQHLTADGPTKTHTFNHALWTTLAVQTDKSVSKSGIIVEATTGIPFPTDVDVVRSDQVTMKVVCDPVVKPASNDLAAAEPDFKVKDIAIRLLTTATKPASPNPGTKCQVSTARVRVATSKAGPVKFKLWSKIGDQPIQSQFVEAWSSFTGPGKYEAVFNKTINVEKTSQIQVMAEDLTNPIGQSTGWKLGRVDCTGAGGGGLTVGPGPSAGDDLPSLKVTGYLGLGEKPAPGVNKPRDASVVFRLWANKAGPTSYKLTCTGGHEWSGSVATTKVGPGKYLGYGIKSVPIDKTTQLACAVRSTSMAGNPVVALATKRYLVVARTPGTEGPNTLTGPSRPTHAPTPPRPSAGGKSNGKIVDAPKTRPIGPPRRANVDNVPKRAPIKLEPRLGLTKAGEGPRPAARAVPSARAERAEARRSR